MLQLPHLSRVKRCEAFIPREDVPTIVSTVEPIVETVEDENEPFTLSSAGESERLKVRSGRSGFDRCSISPIPSG